MSLKVIYSISFIDLLILGLVAPLFRPYLLKLGASELQIGVLESLYQFIAFITGPIAGSLSDNKGRKFILTSTLALNFLGYALLGIPGSFLALCLGRLIIALSSKVQIIAKALIADFAPKDQLSKCFANLGALSGAGFIAGPVLGGYLYQKNQDFSLLSVTVSIAILISLGLVILLPDSKLKVDVKKNTSNSFLNILKETFGNFAKVQWSKFWDVFLLKAFMEASFMLFYMTMGVTLSRDFGASQIDIGYILAFHTILLIVSSLTADKIINKYFKSDVEGRKQNLAAFITLGLSAVGFYFAPNYSTYILFVIPLSLTRGILDSSHMKVLLGRTPEEEKGTVMGAFESVMPFGGFIVPLSVGIIGEIWGANAVKSLGILIPAEACVLLLILLKFNKNVDKKEL